MNTTRNNKKVIWITGGGSGIGRELAKLFSKADYKVIISGRRLLKLENVKHYNVKNIFPKKLDVTNRKNCHKVVNSILKEFGVPDIIILNAATYKPGTLDDINTNDVERIINTNILGPINCYAPMLESMKKKGGQLIFVSSPAGFRGLPGAGIQFH